MHRNHVSAGPHRRVVLTVVTQPRSEGSLASTVTPPRFGSISCGVHRFAVRQACVSFIKSALTLLSHASPRPAPQPLVTRSGTGRSTQRPRGAPPRRGTERQEPVEGAPRPASRGPCLGSRRRRLARGSQQQVPHTSLSSEPRICLSAAPFALCSYG